MLSQSLPGHFKIYWRWHRTAPLALEASGRYMTA